MEQSNDTIGDEIKIKTICEYLFFDQFQDTATFEIFEKCFQPLFNNVKISLEKVFKDICGRKKKYITYKRFARAYIEHIKGNDNSNDTKLFFNKLLNSILKIEKKTIGEDQENVYIFSTIKACRRRKCLTQVQILTDKEGKIHGINLEYDGVYQSKMYPKTIEDDLVVNLEMNLNYLNEKSLKNNMRKHFSVVQDAYRDGVTHIFGTINKKGIITFIGFKCISGKTVFDGFPEGDGFLFGEFGMKFHDIIVHMTKDGITKLEPGFKKNTKKNFYLAKIYEKLLNIDMEDNEIIKDEEKLLNLDDDDEDAQKLITTTIVADNHFFNNKLKDKFFGNDYKEVVDQHPRKWILESSNRNLGIIEEEKENLNLEDTLKLYEKEKEKTFQRSTVLKQKIKKHKGYDPSQNPYKPDTNKKTEQTHSFIPNPFFSFYKKSDLEDTNSDSDTNEDVGKLHKTKIYNPNENKNSLLSKEIGVKETKENWDGNINKKTEIKVFFNKNNYKKLKEELGRKIHEDFIKNNGDNNDIIQQAMLNNIVPYPGMKPQKFENIIEKNNENINKNKKSKPLKMKNLNGKVVVFGKDKKNNKKDEENTKEIIESDASKFWSNFNNYLNNDLKNETDKKELRNINIYEKKSTKKVDKCIERWHMFKKGMKKFNGVYLLQTIGSVLKAMHVMENSIDVPTSEQVRLYKILEENEKIVDFLSQGKSDDEEENEDLIPDEHPERITSLSEIQNCLDNIKRLLEDKDMNKENKKKLEQLYNLYLKQKNILIENETKKAKEQLTKNRNIDVDKYIKEEQEKRRKAQEEEEQRLDEEMEKRTEIISQKINEKRKTGLTSILSTKVSTKIFRDQIMPEGDDDWRDELFMPTKTSLCPYNNDGWVCPKNVLASDVKNWDDIDKWCKAEDINEMGDYDVFIEGATVDDIQQGNIGDCYFLSAVGSLCDPKFELINSLFHIKEKTEENVYGIYFFIDGRWKLVLVDDYFPYKTKKCVVKELFFSCSFQNEIWVSLLEKAWAKLNGCFARIGCGGYCYEAFDVLTEAYTEHIFIDKNKEDEIWEKMENAKEKYAMAAGTHAKSNYLDLDEVGLISGHGYTVIKPLVIEVKKEKVKLVQLKNPWGNQEFNGEWGNHSKKWTASLKKKYKFQGSNDEGIFYMSYKDFLKYFCILDIAKIEKDYKSTRCKIKKNMATKCQVIKLVIDEECPNTFIQLYQKNPRILRKNGTYHPDPVLAYIILAKEVKNNQLQFVNSASSIPSLPNEQYRMHIAIEENLKPGTYYIFCDVNYRFINPKNKSIGYALTFYSKNIIKKFENVTKKIDVSSYFKKVMINYSIIRNKEFTHKNNTGLDFYTTSNFNKEIPFKVLIFKNSTEKNIKVRLDVLEKGKGNKSFCIYNDNIATESDTSVIKEIKPKDIQTVLIMGYAITSEYQISYEILKSDELHPIFKTEGESIDEEGRLLSYAEENDDESGYTIGLENKSNMQYKLRLILEGLISIDPQYKGKDKFEIVISPKSKKVFITKFKEGDEDPSFQFEIA